METFIARQPILDRTERTIAYELLFRDGINNVFPDIDGDVATFRIIIDTFLSSGSENLTNGKTAFINFPQNLIANNSATFLPKDKIVMEILEDVLPVNKVVQALKKLKDDGYIIALDDFIYEEKLLPLIALADIIKFDIKLLDFKEIEKIMEKLNKNFSIEFLAEKVETIKEFEQSKQLGFSYFQGFFFEQPKIIKNKTIPAYKKNLMSLVIEASKQKVDFTKLQSLIKMDIGLSFRLLKLINSAYYKRALKITTIKDAIVALGQNRIVRFIMMVAATVMATGKPEELIKTSIIRARMAELAGPILQSKYSENELFTLGLFSNADAMLGIPMEDLMNEIPFSTRIKKGLLHQGTDFTCILNLISSFEKVDWVKREGHCKNLKIDEQSMQIIYMDALKTADSFLSSLSV
jgi:EAL and modified HD-GYP domain-containing signal transduction protein